jgi:hypothetical protein
MQGKPAHHPTLLQLPRVLEETDGLKDRAAKKAPYQVKHEHS